MKKSILSFILLFVFHNCNTVFAQNQKFDELANEVNRLSLYKKTKPLELLDSMYQIAYSTLDNSMLIARCLYEEALLGERHKIYDTILYNSILQKLSLSDIPHQEEALLYSALGISFMSRCDYSKAFEYLLKALDQYKILNDSLFIARTLNSLGNICSKIGLNNLADSYYSEIFNFINPDEREYYKFILNIISSKIQEFEYDSLPYLLEVAEKKGYEEILPYFYFNMGARVSVENSEKTLFYLNKAQSIDFENEVLQSGIFSGFANYYFKEGDYAKALSYNKEAQKVMELRNSEYLRYIYESIYNIFKELGNNDSALFYLLKYNEENEKLSSNIIAIEKHQKRVTTLNEEYKQRLEEAKQKLEEAKLTIKYKNIRNIIFLIITSIIIVFILFILGRIYRKTKNKETENSELKSILKKEKRYLEYEKKRRKLEKEKQQAIIDEKTREITSNSLILSSKKETLQQVKNVTSQIINNNENAVEAATQIEQIVKNSLAIDYEWDNYKMHFDKVHPQFFKKLKNTCPRLTEENLKMCAFIKMKLSKKQIARLLNITQNTVKVSRQRLKKKMELSKKDSLDDFIDNI